ncbi:MAG: hypothetical protein K2L82_13055 [Lachnospiraceae bacterium]|nr:hypothetical protein [Lachnospiraceae bacterium]
MGNINYDSFYKFLASLGIILIALPFTAILFLFTDSFNLQISEADLAGYTKTAQEVIRLKQSTPLLIEKWYVWIIFAILIITGIKLTHIGLTKWHEIQKIDDICKQMEKEKMEKEINEKTVNMSDSQIIQKKKEEVREEQTNLENVTSESSSFIAQSLLIEQKYFNLLKSSNPSWLIRHNIRIDKYEYDMIVFSDQLFEKDYIYEIKYMRNSITSGRINQCREQMKKLKQNFIEKFNRIPYMVLVIVVPDDAYEQTLGTVEKIEKWNNYSIEVRKESELPNM